MSSLSFLKVNALPENLVSNAVYFVADGNDSAAVDIYVTNKEGTSYRKVFGSSTGTPVTVGNLAKVVDTYADLANVDTTQFNIVMVVDASGDATVQDGAALYVYKDSASKWVKISEVESMDVILDWDKITNRPESTVKQIDDAVKDAHQHTNLEVLDKLSINEEGKLSVDGIAVDSGVNWTASEW